MREHLPDITKEDRLPERDFFWKVFYALHPDQVEAMIKQASDYR